MNPPYSSTTRIAPVGQYRSAARALSNNPAAGFPSNTVRAVGRNSVYSRIAPHECRYDADIHTANSTAEPVSQDGLYGAQRVRNEMRLTHLFRRFR